MKRLLALAFALTLTAQAHAGSIAVTPGSGATVGAGTDGTNQIPATILCGATSSATLYATCVNQAIVNAAGQLLVLAAESGSWTVGVTGSVAVTGTFWQTTQPVSGTFWQTTQPVSAASLPLPTGASTSALQTTGNTALTTINTTLGSPMQNSGGSVTVANTNTNLTPADAVTTSTYNVGSPTIGVPLLWNGTTYDRWKEGSAAGVGLMSLTGSLPAFGSPPTVALNTTPSLANGNGVVPTQGGTALSATNGGYTNILQGNAVLSAATGLPVAPSPYPAGAVPITASATGTTAATTATLTNVTGHTTYICGFSIRANATAAATGNATVTGTVSGTLNFTQWTAPNASGVGVTEIPLAPCIPASAVSTSIAVVSAAPGTGGVISVTAWGYSI